MTEAPDVAALPPAELREQATELRLYGLLGHWAEVMGQPEQARWVSQLLGWEAAERSRRSLERRLREAHLGSYVELSIIAETGRPQFALVHTIS